MHRGRQAGFTYLSLLFVIVFVGIGLAQVGARFSDDVQREHEADLLRIGDEIVRAIRSYHLASVGPVKTLPRGWDDLLEDRRSTQVRRHLRSIPRDPLTAGTEWEIVRDEAGAMVGIRSRSTSRPFRTSGAEVDGRPLPVAAAYRDWAFVYEPAPIRKPK
jgi:hypothetical protein